MIILGIDPGTTAVGYALLQAGAHQPTLREAKLLHIRSRNSGERLEEIHRELKRVLALWKPAAAAVEKLFFAKNVKTALAVSEGRGVILLTTALAGCGVYEYTPLEIKKAVTGDGRADKRQVKKMIQLTLPEATLLRAPDDVFDAIAVALTCYFTTPRHLLDRRRSKVQSIAKVEGD